MTGLWDDGGVQQLIRYELWSDGTLLEQHAVPSQWQWGWPPPMRACPPGCEWRRINPDGTVDRA